MKDLVIYHDNCPDGFTAAWAVWKELGDRAEYRGFNYGNEPPHADAKGRRVILVDFSFPRAKLDTLAAVAKSVEVYDHHKTAEADLRGWAEEGPDRTVVFDMERSGAGIAWDVFHGRPRPRLVDYVEDRDLWRWTLAGSREAGEYVFSWPRTFEIWDNVQSAFGADFASVIFAGSALLRAKRARVEQICKHARLLTFGDMQIPVVNTAWDFSEIGEYLTSAAHVAGVYLAGGYYFDRADGKRQWGFRSVGDCDVSALCTRYGGGGHKNAAGFTSETGWLPS